MRATSNGVLPHCFLVRPRVSCAHLLGLGDLMEIKEWRHNTILHTLSIKGGGLLNSIFPSPQNRIHKGGYESPIVPKRGDFCFNSVLQISWHLCMTSRHHLQKFSHTAWGCKFVPIYTHFVGLCPYYYAPISWVCAHFHCVLYLCMCVIHPYLVLGRSRLEIRGCDYRPQYAQLKFSEPKFLCKST